ncbi:hypothetical protein ACEQ38_08025 [Ralstonia syzygii subsp. celebesensis]|uniref:hypothetical protein n=1 Tax=Ralstonia syzygii TaxID=28097 RepID=UPI0012FDC0CF|nr:hypothetical protein [Ralstonia syzygii]QQV54609.1 hypothetical protein JK151_10520 [Ralstonia syzygii subsp. celebesensis]
MIPPMTDPLGRFWKQPDRTEILMDSKHAVMNRSSFDRLSEYSTSRPTGVYPGKMWKSITRDGAPYLCWYGIVEGRDDLCSNNARQILICD